MPVDPGAVCPRQSRAPWAALTTSALPPSENASFQVQIVRDRPELVAGELQNRGSAQAISCPGVVFCPRPARVLRYMALVGFCVADWHSRPAATALTPSTLARKWISTNNDSPISSAH